MLHVQELELAHRRGVPLIKNLSFSVNAGSLLHVKGPNGCGKSTLLSSLAGLHAPTSGCIKFESGSDQVIQKAYLPAESDGHFIRLDAINNLKFWTSMGGRHPSDSDLVSALTQWGLGHELTRQGLPVMKFSTGMKRRLALCRISLSHAACWLLDEPTRGLDHEAIQLLRTTIASHISSGGTAVVVSHDDLDFDSISMQTLELKKYAPRGHA